MSPILLAPKAGHFAPKAKSIIHLFMHGGPSHVDTFDYKPSLAKYQGQRPDAVKDLGTERRTFNLFPSPFKFSKHGQSGLEISEAVQGSRDMRRRPVRDSLDAHRHSEPRSGHHDDVQRLEPDEPPVARLMAARMAWGARTKTCPASSRCAPARPAYVGPQLWSNSFLPGIYQGCHVNHRDPDPNKVMDHLKNLQLGNKAQREQLDLLQGPQRAARGEASKRIGAADAHPVDGNGLPHADGSARGVRSFHRNAGDARCLRQRALQRRLHSRAAACRARRAGGAALLRFARELGLAREHRPSRRVLPPRRPADRRAARRT